MNYRKIYNDLIYKRKYIDILTKKDTSDRHHIIPRSMGGKEVVRLTIREHIFAHELLAMIYKKEEVDKNAYHKMLLALERMCNPRASTYCRLDRPIINSKILSLFIQEARKVRKNKTRIKNVILGKTKYWDKDTPLTQEMIDEGWGFGFCMTDHILQRRKEAYGNKKWMCKDGCDDIFIDKDMTHQYLENGWKFGRNNLPVDYIEDRYNRFKNDPKYRGNMKDRIWIYNPLSKQSMTIHKNDEIPDGFVLGRYTGNHKNIMKDQLIPLWTEYKNNNFNWESIKDKSQFTKNKDNFLQLCRKYLKDIYIGKEEQTKNRLAKLLEEFNKNGYDGCVKNLGYPGSRHSLLHLFSNNNMVYESKPQWYNRMLPIWLDAYKKYGYEYICKNLGCKSELKTLISSWKRRNMI